MTVDVLHGDSQPQPGLGAAAADWSSPKERLSMIDHITFSNLALSRTDVKSALSDDISDFFCVRSVHDASVNVRTSFCDVRQVREDMVTVHNLERTTN